LTGGTPVLGAPDGTAVIWLPRPSVVAGRAVGTALRASAGLVDGTGLGTAPGAEWDGAVVGAEGTAVGWPGVLLSADADSAPAPASTVAKARTVSKLRVRMRALSPRSIRDGSLGAESRGETTGMEVRL
jgi:hypothetical protein